MNARLIVWLGLLLVCSLTATADAARRRPAGPALDSGYVGALAAANRFLHCWETQDHEGGLLLLSDPARRKTSPNWLEAFFSAGDNLGYEISRGKRLKNGEYAFPVTLFHLNSSGGRKIQVHYSQLVVVHSGRDEWLVDSIP